MSYTDIHRGSFYASPRSRAPRYIRQVLRVYESITRGPRVEYLTPVRRANVSLASFAAWAFVEVENPAK